MQWVFHATPLFFSLLFSHSLRKTELLEGHLLIHEKAPMDDRLASFLLWIENTREDAHKPSSAAFISPKLAVKYLEGTGRGIYADEPIGAHERLVSIPALFLLNATTATRHITHHNPLVELSEPFYSLVYVPFHTEKDVCTDIYALISAEELLALTGFQLLSFYLTLEKHRGKRLFWEPFLTMLPDTDSDLKCTPLVWRVLDAPEAAELDKLLPRSAARHTERVYARYMADYEVVKELVSSKLAILGRSESLDSLLSPKDYLTAWMCVNLRCLYMKMPQSKIQADNMTLAPYVDFLNHTCDDQCVIKIDGRGFQVFSSTRYSVGDQLYFSYGPHSNEFLLCEYGFTLPENSWNHFDISDYIVPLLNPAQLDFLEAHGYAGDYTVNSYGMSFRVEVALAVLQEPVPAESRRLAQLIGGISDGSYYQEHSRELSKAILEKVMHVSNQHVNLEYNDDEHADTRLRKRAIGVLHRDTRNVAERVLGNISGERKRAE